MSREKQVDSSYYNVESYVKEDRWMSFYDQIMEIHRLKNTRSILEIGTESRRNRNHIEEHLPHVTYQTADIAADLSPDYIGSIDGLPVEDKTFDSVLAFEVMEHLPFDRFEVSLSELNRVARTNVVISLPHFGPPISMMLKLPLLHEIKVSTKIWVPLKHKFNGQHYWEIGKRGYSPWKIRKIIQKHFTIEREYIPFWNQYHHFFVLKVK